MLVLCRIVDLPFAGGGRCWTRRTVVDRSPWPHQHCNRWINDWGTCVLLTRQFPHSRNASRSSLTVFWMTDWLIADVCNFQRNGQQTPQLLPVLKRTPALTTKCSGTKKWFRIWTWRWKVRHNINSCPRSRGLPSLLFSLSSTLSVFLLQQTPSFIVWRLFFVRRGSLLACMQINNASPLLAHSCADPSICLLAITIHRFRLRIRLPNPSWKALCGIKVRNEERAPKKNPQIKHNHTLYAICWRESWRRAYGTYRSTF